jgi:transcription elongation factor GreA
MNNAPQYLTQQKYDTLTKELEYLKTARRKEVADNLEYAKKLGDLSENAEYHEARERQAEVEDRIRHLDEVLKTASIVEGTHGDTVTIGSTLKITREGEIEERTYRIVGSEEADSAKGMLSNLSPLGNALMGKKSGDTVKIKTPKGSVGYTIVSIE